MQHIEVELRGPLNDSSHTTLIEYLKKNGTYTKTQSRLFFDLSKTIGINNRDLDVRVKVTNGQIQIVAKKGALGSASREEAEVVVAEGSLGQALHALSLLGYPKGVYGDRKIERYMLGDIEFAIQDVVRVTDGTVHSRFYEAEIMATSEGKGEAEEKIRAILADLKLPVFDISGWNTYEAIINKEANGWFEYGTTDISRFLK